MSTSGQSLSKKDKQALGPAESKGAFVDTHGVITTTSNELPGYRVKRVLGTCYGLTVRSRNWAAGFTMVAKSIIGGELRWLTNLLYNSRQDAAERCIGECMARGGNALIALRFEISDSGGFANACCYGTACIVEPITESS